MKLNLFEKYLATAKRKTHNSPSDDNYIDLATYENFIKDLLSIWKI